MSQQETKTEDSAQARFDKTYISSVEILEELHVSRAAVCQARKRGLLPDAVVSHGGSMVLWERDKLRPNLDAWKLMLDVRRTNAV